MRWVNIEYPAYCPQWVVLELSDSRPVARLRLAGNQKSKISDNGVNAAILSLKKIGTLFLRSRYLPTMVVGFVLPALVGFTFVMIAAYAGTLRALEVYFDPTQDSIFLSEDSGPPKGR